MSNEKVFKKGELIFSANDHGHCAFIIDRGSVEIFTTCERTKIETQVAVLHRGEIFGEMAVIDGSERSASARAFGDCQLTEVSPDQLSERIGRSDPIVRLLLSVLLKRIRVGLPTQEENESSTSTSTINEHELNLDDPSPLDRIRIESALSEALTTGALVLHYQPLIKMDGQRAAGFEALIRWSHPSNGMISPGLFMGIAEETSLIIPIGQWVCRESCRQFAELKNAMAIQGYDDKYLDELFMSINVSGRQLEDPHFFSTLEKCLKDYNLEARHLKLEITERVLVDADEAKQWIGKARGLGFQVALDDFGTGFSSLQYLSQFTVDNIKLDRSFIVNIHENPKAQVIVDAILKMARGLGCSTTAEGIEIVEEAERLAQLGCTYAQGYYFARPMAMNKLIDHFAAGDPSQVPAKSA